MLVTIYAVFRLRVIGMVVDFFKSGRFQKKQRNCVTRTLLLLYIELVLLKLFFVTFIITFTNAHTPLRFEAAL
jgi:hypothetical protein